MSQEPHGYHVEVAMFEKEKRCPQVTRTEGEAIVGKEAILEKEDLFLRYILFIILYLVPRVMIGS